MNIDERYSRGYSDRYDAGKRVIAQVRAISLGREHLSHALWLLSITIVFALINLCSVSVVNNIQSEMPEFPDLDMPKMSAIPDFPIVPKRADYESMDVYVAAWDEYTEKLDEYLEMLVKQGNAEQAAANEYNAVMEAYNEETEAYNQKAESGPYIVVPGLLIGVLPVVIVMFKIRGARRELSVGNKD